MKKIFLGGLIVESQRSLINSDSIGSVQHAADALQQGFIAGFSELKESNFVVFNFPFVGSYPKRFRRLFYPASVDHVGSVVIQTIAFCNLMWFKQIFRTVSSLVALLRGAERNSWILVYSAHPPFIFSALLCRFFKRRVKLCLIVPDLPEFMGESCGVGGALNRLFNRFFMKSVRYFDGYAVLTRQMIERLGVDEERCVVIEGIASQKVFSFDEAPEEESVNAVLYTGTLAEKYGVKNLVDAFLGVEDRDARLWICGEGDSKMYIEEAVRKDSRIQYFGQIDRSDAIALQRRASVLVNPRLPLDEFTKFSFPSKIMEYFSSRRPVVMYRLPGIPEEYFDYCFVPKDLTVLELQACLEKVLNMSNGERLKFATRACEFVAAQKNPIVQVKKLQILLDKLGSRCD